VHALTQLAGFNGIVVGVFLFFCTWLLSYLRLEKGPFEFDVQGEKGSFKELFSIYLDIAKFILGLASGSIALLVGTAAFHPAGDGRLLATYASPLFLLALSILWGVFFMVFMVLDYEAYRHKTKLYTRLKYSRNLAFGFSCLLSFSVGYLWLIVIVAGWH